ncbi:MAG: peptidyl-prolyl cis-trans isomerase C [Paracoccaceae bacterium]|jgi:peptidyl-prolyl cis-trans isomerase C
MAKILRFIIFFNLCFVFIGGDADFSRAQDVNANRVVARVDGTEITIGEMIVLRDSLPDQYKHLPADVLFNGLLEQLIQQTALEKTMAGKLGTFDLISLGNFRRSYVANLVLQQVVANVATPEALQDAYHAHLASIKEQTEYHAAHILVASREQAQALSLKIDGGANFSELARKFSTDPGSGADGGDLGWFGVGAMVAPFEAAVVSMKVGAVSKPVQTDFGWHLIELIETRIQAVPTLKQMGPDLTAELEQIAVNSYLLSLLKDVDVQRDVDGLNPNTLNDESIFEAKP